MNQGAPLFALASVLLVAGCATGFQSISGSVSAPDGTAIEGATVCARTRWNVLAIHAACNASDETGRYRIDGVLDVPYSLSASAPQRKPKSVDLIDLRDGRSEANVGVVLEPGGALVKGRVLDRAGAPIGGAIIGAWSGGSICAWVQSNDRGEYEAWLDNGPVSIGAEADGYVASAKEDTAPATVDLLLEPESSISGRVIHRRTGEPIEEATITVTLPFYSGRCLHRERLAATSDSDGRFTIGRLPGGRFLPSVSGGRWHGRARAPISMGFVDRVADVVVEVDRTYQVSGRVRGLGGKACSKAGAMLDPSKDDQFDEILTHADADGRFIFDSVPRGDYELQGWCDNAPTSRALRVDGDISDLVLETTTTAQAWAVVKGRVIDEAGAPVSGVLVALQRAGTAASFSVSDRDGFFLLGVNWSGRAEVGTMRNSIWFTEPIVSRTLEVGREAEPVTLILPQRGQLRGRVVTSSGAPVARAHVALAIDLKGLTDRNGEFQVEGVPPGRHPLEVSAGQLLLKGEPSSIEVKPGAIVESTIVVENVDGRIEGRVVDEHGSPVSNATVHIARDDDSRPIWSLLGREDGVVSGNDGEFELEGLVEDAFTIVAQRAGSGAGHTTGMRPGQPATVVLHPHGSITGRVEIRDGASPDEFRIQLGGDDALLGKSGILSFTHAEGRFQIDDLVAGDYTLAVLSAAGIGHAEVRVESGKETRDVIVRIEGHTTVRGRLIDLDSGQPAPGVPVSIADATFQRRRTGTSKADGTFEIDEVPAARVEIHAPWVAADPVPYVWMVPSVEVELQPLAVNDVPPIYVRRNPLRDGDRRGYFGLGVERARSGAFVREPEPDSPAARAGVRAGDEITHVDGADVTGPNGYQFWLRIVAKVGQEMEFRLRDGRVLRLTAEPPP
jgi:protocatechuate 3,4-dioxygenase beta subunit